MPNDNKLKIVIFCRVHTNDLHKRPLFQKNNEVLKDL